MIKELYIFSGLGADERAFQRLDLSDYSTTFIKWITPQSDESIEHYAKRLLDQITTARPILIGLSFGGLISIEVAKQIDTEKVIVISSAKTHEEIPFYFRLAGRFCLHKLLPSALLRWPNAITFWFFGTKTKHETQLLSQILADTDPTFLRWAIDQVVRWKNRTRINDNFHIHGESDRILPLRFVNCNATIKHGGHFMVLNKADELSRILRQQIGRGSH